VDQDIISLFLEITCTTHNCSYLDPSFFPKLEESSWSSVKNRFSNYSIHGSTIQRPDLIKDLGIAIPVHIDGNHWIAVTRRNFNGRIIFFYADDLNNQRYEQRVNQILSTENTSPLVRPENSQWINCSNFTYCPHSNECGPRTLLALYIMLSHPSPNQTMLLPYMSPNLAQIA
jgi:hypothetical protein